MERKESNEEDIARQSVGNVNNDDTDSRYYIETVYSGQTQAASIPASPSNVLPRPGVSRDAEEYFMGHPERGVALIFSHEKFDVRRYLNYQPKTRKGAAVDRNQLHATFRSLGFEVLCFDDLPHNQIRNELRRVSQQRHDNHDCVAVAVLSHGERGGMLDARDCEYPVSELWEPFTARQCPSLAGKPKLFFIQACKGTDSDPGAMVEHIVMDSTDDGRDAELTYPVPSYADILVAYSTFEGLNSYRNERNGSWYIQTLCSQLEVHSKTMDLMSLLTNVNRIVGQNFRSLNLDPQLHGMVQGPCFTSSLTRRLTFR